MKYKVVAKQGLKLPYKFLKEGSTFESGKIAATPQYLDQLVKQGIIAVIKTKQAEEAGSEEQAAAEQANAEGNKTNSRGK